jgi:Low affinity iron permease
MVDHLNPARSGSQRYRRGQNGHRPSYDFDDMPSSVSARVGLFDRFAGAASGFASRAWFFAGCVLLVVIWAPSFFVFGSVDTWQLIINTATTIITFLLVALLQNTQTRADQATQHKLNALAEGLATLMRENLDAATADADDGGLDPDRLRRDIHELRQAVGLEERESA